MKRRMILLAAVLALFAAQARADNPEIERLYNEDQADREGGPNASKDWAAVEKRDGERRVKVREIVEKGGATTSMDYYRAAMVYQARISGYSRA